MRWLGGLVLLVPFIAFADPPLWTQTTYAAPGGGYYYLSSTQGAYCDPNDSCYAQYVQPNVAPPLMCTEQSGGSCWGTYTPVDSGTGMATPGGPGDTPGPGQGGGVQPAVGASVLAGLGPYTEIAKTLAIICAPVLLVAVGWSVLRNLRSGIRMAGGGSDVAPRRWTDKEVRDSVRADRRALMKEEREDRAWERYEERREARMAKGGNW